MRYELKGTLSYEGADFSYFKESQKRLAKEIAAKHDAYFRSVLAKYFDPKALDIVNNASIEWLLNYVALSGLKFERVTQRGSMSEIVFDVLEIYQDGRLLETSAIPNFIPLMTL